MKVAAIVFVGDRWIKTSSTMAKWATARGLLVIWFCGNRDASGDRIVA